MRFFRWTLIIIVALALLIGGLRLYGSFVANPKAVNEIRSNPQGERADITMLLTFPDGRMLPVNYLREDDKVFVGADGPWWRQFQGDGQMVSLEIRTEKFVGNAVVILDDPEYTKRIFKRLRPTVPKWLPDWLNGKLIVISLAQMSMH